MVIAPAPKHTNMHTTPITIPMIVPDLDLFVDISGSPPTIVELSDSSRPPVGFPVGVIVETTVDSVVSVVLGRTDGDVTVPRDDSEFVDEKEGEDGSDDDVSEDDKNEVVDDSMSV